MASVKEKPVETVETVTNPWDTKVKITLPRAKAGEEKTLFVSVNGRSFQVPKGKPVEVPQPVYEVLEGYLDNLDIEQAVIDQVPNNA